MITAIVAWIFGIVFGLATWVLAIICGYLLAYEAEINKWIGIILGIFWLPGLFLLVAIWALKALIHLLSRYIATLEVHAAAVHSNSPAAKSS